MRESERNLSASAELGKRSSVYDAKQTAEIRTQAIKNAISAQLSRAVKAPVRTDLNDLSAVKEVAERYIEKCSECGVLPSYEGLACCLGISRNYAYEYPRKHPESATTAYLDNLRLGMASLRMALAENKVIDCASAIFILKNSGFGMADRVEIPVQEHTSPFSECDSEEARQRLIEKYIADIPEPDEDE